jgi:DNA-binding CsgD family transcriptional regulator
VQRVRQQSQPLVHALGTVAARYSRLRWLASAGTLLSAQYDDVVHADADSGTETLLARAQQAMEGGEWPAAREAFEAVLERAESGEALYGLGMALWWLGETEPSLRRWERAYALFRQRADPEQALLAAFSLCLAYRMSLGNDAASQGWLGRASSLVEEFELGPLAGWVLVARAYVSTDGGHPEAGEGHAREARRIAREAGDSELELFAMGELGAALVELGRVEEGVALLDEAMAGALAGEGGSLETIVVITCRTITSCSRGGDLARATQWVRAADGFHRRYGSPHLYTTCRTHYGSILLAAGEWEQAERELQAALEIGRKAEPALHAEALAKLAELRLAQGRMEEAERLLGGYEDHPASAYAAAGIRLARGETAAAASILRRRLRELDERSPAAARLLELLTEVELARGSIEEATGLAGRLAQLGGNGSELIVACGDRALGRALTATGELEAALAHLEPALAAFGRLQMPLEVGRTRLLVARALAGGDQESAAVEGRAALACFEQLGAARDADAAAGFLRSLGVKAARAGPKRMGVLTKRELEVLGLLGEGLSNPEIAERLFISRRTVEHHVASVLSKLGLRGRGEAAAYALRNLAREGSSGSK